MKLSEVARAWENGLIEGVYLVHPPYSFGPENRQKWVIYTPNRHTVEGCFVTYDDGRCMIFDTLDEAFKFAKFALSGLDCCPDIEIPGFGELSESAFPWPKPL